MESMGNGEAREGQEGKRYIGMSLKAYQTRERVTGWEGVKNGSFLFSYLHGISKASMQASSYS